MADEVEEKAKKSLWQKYSWSLTKNDLIDFLPDSFIVCNDVRDNFYSCTERVGLMRASVDCSKYLEDYRECRFGEKKWKRLKAIAEQRYKQGRPPVPKMPADHQKYGNRWNTEDM